MVPYRFVVASMLVLAAVGIGRAGDSAPTKRCDPAGSQTVDVRLTPPAGITLAGVKVRFDYPEQAVTLAGRGDDTDVKARVTAMPSGALGVPNDEDDALLVALVSTAPLPSGRIFTVALETCRGSKAVEASGYRCAVEEASDEQGQLVSGATCTVTLRNETEGEKS